MKELFLEMFKGLLLGMCFVLFCFVIASPSRSAYAVDLSKSTSVTPQRHCGFIVLNFCLASQAAQKTSASVTATHTRLQSLYEGQTRQNKSAMVNMSGGSSRPRVMPLTSLLIGETSQNSKLLGGNSHA
ncbi:hypothetical protein [Acinetobacter indicus]|uniref:hypothetical protein n=1 Tax=Acinetobacter indicus TaxID=756892 RepID=UPI0025784824|nr:hypothetical protein [Acinetobacter indicus]